MNRRRFLEMLGMATAGGVVAYSFPSVIVPKNIVAVYAELPSGPNFVNIEDFFRAQVASAAKWFDANTITHPPWPEILKTARVTQKFMENKQLIVVPYGGQLNA